MVECLPRGPEHWQKWVDAAEGNLTGIPSSGFHSTVDFPSCSSYRALAEHYPEAKVVPFLIVIERVGLLQRRKPFFRLIGRSIFET